MNNVLNLQKLDQRQKEEGGKFASSFSIGCKVGVE
ncbi:class III lanthipeptide [Bacillus sp. SM2101]|nr:class III lanthipeptide [Bacillus sp. SM2101]